jgi:hypothetical protein
MALVRCRECERLVSDKARACPHCGVPYPAQTEGEGTGYEWKSKWAVYGYPLVHIAFGTDGFGKKRVARGVFAIGQYAIGLVTIAQFGVGILFAFGQFVVGTTAIGQFAITALFGIGQFATGYVAIGQFAVGYYALCQIGFAPHLWTIGHKDVQAVQFFTQLWDKIKEIFPFLNNF